MALRHRFSFRSWVPSIPWLSLTVLALAALAWGATALLHGYGPAFLAANLGEPTLQDFVIHDNAMGGHALHHRPTATGWANDVPLWLIGWIIMVVAMMMPPALPYLQIMARLVEARPAKGWLLLVSASAFVLAWTIAGLMLMAGGGLFSTMIERIPFISERPFLPAGAAAMLVGGYQFTPLKKSCLAACRSPASIVMTRWRAETPFIASAEIGLRYGIVCVGCCWALMILSLIVGAFALPVMVGSAVIMAAERMLPWVRPLIPLQAALAGFVGLLLLLGLVPPAYVWN